VNCIRAYLKEIEMQLAMGGAAEHTHRPALQRLVQSLEKGLTVTNEPRRIACGAPDFIIGRGDIPIGYIEAKDIGVRLDEAEKSDQLKRYLDGLPNLILTDYLEFRLYQQGEFVMEARLGRVGHDAKLRANEGAEVSFGGLFGAFFAGSFPHMATPVELARHMAATARILRDVIERAFQQEETDSPLHGQFEAFRKVLLHDLEPAQFADMYAQTICYGLFAACCNHKPGNGMFTRKAAVYDLHETSPFIRQKLMHIAGPELDSRLAWAVDHLTALLENADLAAVLKDFGRRTRQEDPVVHFYETFLSAYDPKMRRTRGVYYTPEPVVSYIVRSVDTILKRDLKIMDGLASTEKTPHYERHLTKQKNEAQRRKKTGEFHKVLILDPATGTGTFLHGVVDHIHEAVTKKQGAGAWDAYVSAHLLPRLFGFELLLAPYAVAHMKLGIQLAETGYTFRSGERLGVYLTNTLEEAFTFSGLPLFADLIAKEANSARETGTTRPVMVVLGNPPYSGHSENRGAWIHGLMRGSDGNGGHATKTGNYFEVDGKPLNERNPKWLNDDYVKFIRFAQWRIESTGHGVLAFISNHGYLDNPTFRGMRQSLMQAFDDIYILDLHGNTKKRETAEGGSIDENVFDIQQGVAIGIFVRREREYGLDAPRRATVRHAELRGMRQVYTRDAQGARRLTGGKYGWLNENDLESTPWSEVEPVSPYYLFSPQDRVLREEYEAGWSVHEAMPLHSVGLVTARDSLTIHLGRDEMWRTVREFCSLSPDEARERFLLGKDTRDWQVALAQKDVKRSGPDIEKVTPIAYRPFDLRWTYYTGQTRGFICMPRPAVMNHMIAGPNLALITARSNKSSEPDHFFCGKTIVEAKCGERTTQSALFPLYLYPKTDDDVEDIEAYVMKEEAKAYGARHVPNLKREFIDDVSARLKMTFVPDGRGDLKKTFGPEDVFHYIYAIFHAPSYRARYAAFLKIDFPSIPLTSSKPLFRQLCGLGAKLVGLHLLYSVPEGPASFPVAGTNGVDGPRYVEDQKRVYINDTQYFDQVPKAAWDFHIGGYQVCCKWLKDRKSRQLDFEDIAHYRKIVAALAETHRHMNQIDEVIEAKDGWPIA
jgi:hypothetical protein